MQRLKLFSVIITFLSILISCLFKLSQNLNNLTYREYCPFCCGTSLCEVINNGEIQFDDAYFFQNTINKLFSNKLTLFGVWGNKSVVIKTFKLPQQQVVTSNKWLKYKFDNVKSAIQNIKNILNERVLLKYYNFRKIWLCPNADNVDFLISVNSENNIVSSNDSEVLNDYIHFWTLLQVNAEPIIQKVLQGWAVSGFIGCCGLVVVSENSGEMLTTFAKTATWKEKISISKQLLEAALTFTFDHPKFSFYFTDISADNVAISKEGRLKFIDMDDVIIVDKNPTIISRSWNKIHSSKMYDPGLLSFSVQEICSHNISDHNIYAVCREILGKTSPLILGGLLHSSSEEIRTKFAKLLDVCIQGPNRFEAANELLKVLKSEM